MTPDRPVPLSAADIIFAQDPSVRSQLEESRKARELFAKRREALSRFKELRARYDQLGQPFKEIDRCYGITASLQEVKEKILEGRGTLMVTPPYEVGIGGGASLMEQTDIIEGRCVSYGQDRKVVLKVCRRSDLVEYHDPIHEEEIQIGNPLKFKEEGVSMRVELSWNERSVPENCDELGCSYHNSGNKITLEIRGDRKLTIFAGDNFSRTIPLSEANFGEMFSSQLAEAYRFSHWG